MDGKFRVATRVGIGLPRLLKSAITESAMYLEQRFSQISEDAHLPQRGVETQRVVRPKTCN